MLGRIKSIDRKFFVIVPIIPMEQNYNLIPHYGFCIPDGSKFFNFAEEEKK